MNRLTLIAQLLGFSIALLRATLRVEQLNGRYYADLKARRVPILFALWHGRMFLPINAHRNESIATMASQSKDGNIIARWLEGDDPRDARIDDARRKRSAPPYGALRPFGT